MVMLNLLRGRRAQSLRSRFVLPRVDRGARFGASPLGEGRRRNGEHDHDHDDEE